MSRDILEAMTALAREKGISPEKLMAALEDALLSAYKKLPGAARYARVEVDAETGDFVVIRYRIPKDLEAELIGETIAEESYIDPETGDRVEPQDPEIDPAKFEQYRDRIEEIDDTPEDFGRIAAQTAKQVILQRIREAERDMMFEEFRDRVGELITGIVQQSDSRYTLVQLRDRVEALLPKGEQVDGERYDHGQRVKAVIKEVSPSTKGPSIIVSRRDGELIKKLFELEVPEIADGLVEIANVAREPGYRSKIAVISHADGVDPVGACVGPRGSRVRMVVSELRGEKIDIIPYNDEPARFVAKALSPARVREVLVDDESKQATVIVPDDQLSLAIGREGQNARLAARLTGWRIDIKSETDFAATATTAEDYEGAEEVGGRCQAISVRGRRCPNEALPGSPFCGLPKHQALSRFTTAAVAILEPLSDEEIGDLSDPDKTWDDVVDIVTRAEELYGDQEEVVVDESAEPEEGEFDEGVEPLETAPDEAVDEALQADVADDGLEPAPEAAEPDGEVDAQDADEPVAEAETQAEEPAS
jgi:N utilization substance protein A